MSKRFDYRSKDTFKKDIKFGTRLEQYWWAKWVAHSFNRDDLEIVNAGDNGCGNDGEFIEKGNTAGADFIADITYQNETHSRLPIEMKWVPTAGKFTLKENDLKAYIREGAAILFVYNSVKCGADLRKPKDYDYDRHIKLIESKMDQMRWGLMLPDQVAGLYNMGKLKGWFKPVRYMGNKSALILKDEDFYQWFKREAWNV